MSLFFIAVPQYEDTCKLFCFSRLDGHLDCYLFLAIMSRTALSMPGLVFRRTRAIISLGCVVCHEIAGFVGYRMFSLCRHFKTVFQSDSTRLLSHAYKVFTEGTNSGQKGLF